MKVLRLENVKKYYGTTSNITKAVNGISFEVEEGEFVAIMGASGSGKTTLLNAISTIDHVTSGHIFVGDKDITELKEDEKADFRKDNLGFIFQDFNLLDTLNIEENIALSLIFDDAKDKISKKELDKIDNYIDQVLYYARSNTTGKDYFVKELDLSSVIHNVLLKYRDYLLEQKIKITTTNLEKKIYTDEKWLQFVISQIIQNSIKYMDKSKKEIIITGEETKENITLTITDNGCGIKESDISRVFEKGFTGSNRGKESSTGIGLYLAKKICVELGLTISIQSIYKEKTTVKIIFPITDFNKFE